MQIYTKFVTTQSLSYTTIALQPRDRHRVSLVLLEEISQALHRCYFLGRRPARSRLGSSSSQAGLQPPESAASQSLAVSQSQLSHWETGRSRRWGLGIVLERLPTEVQPLSYKLQQGTSFMWIQCQTSWQVHSSSGFRRIIGGQSLSVGWKLERE